MIRAIPNASLRSLLLICIFNTALACRASIQMTGNPRALVSVHNHVDVGPVSRPIDNRSPEYHGTPPAPRNASHDIEVVPTATPDLSKPTLDLLSVCRQIS